MAQKNFWGWLNIGRDGQLIEGESGSGQQYFATKEKAPITRPATAESIAAEPGKSVFWSVVFWLAYITILCLILPFVGFFLAVGRFDDMLEWLDRKRG